MAPIMRILLAIFVFGAATLFYTSRIQTAPKPIPLTTDYRFDNVDRKTTAVTPKKVAIIGAGAAGASAAYYLRRYASNASIPLEITVFERSEYVGGRSTTVDAWNDPDYPIELGASIFVEVNSNLVSATKELGLEVVDLESESITSQEEEEPEFSANFAVYNGDEFVFTMPYINGKKDAWWNNMKVLWRYGLAPIYTQRLMKATVAKFLSMYTPPIFPFSDLTETAIDVGLLEATGVTGEQFMNINGIKSKWNTELVQASTRVNYGQNLGLIHGLETMVCMAAEGAIAIKGGNWRIFSGMIARAEATLKLKTAVKGLIKDKAGKWTVATEAGDSYKGFDDVVLATQYQFADLLVSPELEQKPDSIPFVTLHVTLFASPYKPSSAFFNLEHGHPVPEAVLTTLTEAEQADEKITNGEGKHAVGKSGFFSISTLKKVARPNADGTTSPQYIYKVFSPLPFTDDRLAALLGVEKVNDKTVTWVYRKEWKSYPFEYPRVTFEKIKLAEGLWYTSGIESFISTMETSSLMGSNVAALVVKKWLGLGDEAKGGQTERVKADL